LETLKAWEAFHIADSAAPYLSDAFVQARFAFRNKVLSGQPQIADRWKRGVHVVTANMGEAIGKVYVARYFPPESKAKMIQLTSELKSAFQRRIENLTWMGPATKAEALKKLSSYTIRIGYPDTWRDYSSLVIRSDDLYGDVERSQAFEWKRQTSRLNQPVDKAEWEMTPQEVNAYNEPLFNEVVFPAAILQAPFFDPKADPAINYGGIGGVIGHEMTHGFDDEGRKFDASGHLRDWWTAEDAKRFEALAKKLGDLYSSYSPLPGAHVNGQLTMGENIADLGGLTLALDAYHASLHGKPAPVINGLTGDQRVFLGWAQVWTSKIRDDALRQQVVTDPHSPAQYRVNGVVRNIDAWYRAFDVKPGEALYLTPEARVRIW
jgi:putative endopeptidase